MKYILLVILFMSQSVAADSANKKVQKLNFEDESVDGKVRQPDGSYIVQKRGVDFIPLYKLRDNFDDQVEQSLEYIK